MNRYKDTMLNDPEKIRDKLFLLDEECKKEGIRATFMIIGGSAIQLLLGSVEKEFRATVDIDVAGLDSNHEQLFLSIARKHGIEDADGVLLPTAEEMREIDELIFFDDGHENIEVYLPTFEMMVCIKSLSNRQKDYDDIVTSSLLDHCDIEKTIELIEEYKDFLLNPNSFNNHHEEILQILRDKV